MSLESTHEVTGSRRLSTRQLLRALVALLVGSVNANVALAQNDPVFDAKGLQQNRDYFSQFTFENIDTAGGGLTLTFTDLVLPGNGGHDLRFMRATRSKGTGGFGISGIVLFVADPWWVSKTGVDYGATLNMVDDGEQVARIPLAQTVNGATNIVMTDRFWKYYRDSRMVWMPDGSVGYYDTAGRLTQWTDSFGNLLTIQWQGQQAIVTQSLGSQSRQVVLQFPVEANGTRNEFCTSLDSLLGGL